MPKSSLEFHIPDESDEFYSALHGSEYRGALWNLDQQLRNWLKYGHEFKSIEEALTAARDKIYQLTENLDLE